MSDIKKLLIFTIIVMIEITYICFSSILFQSLSTDLLSVFIFYFIWLALAIGSMLLMVYLINKIFTHLRNKGK
jgi:TRAP-type C4-dicarboxylate transport system permease small subunit